MDHRQMGHAASLHSAVAAHAQHSKAGAKLPKYHPHPPAKVDLLVIFRPYLVGFGWHCCESRVFGGSLQALRHQTHGQVA